MQLVLTPALILEAYRNGLFPMAYSADSPHINWICPDMRGQLSITDIHIPKRLAKTIRSAPYAISVNENFEDVMAFCAEEMDNRPETWINNNIHDVFVELHAQGYAHSVEVWQNDELVGGLYGLCMNGAFFGESMFSRARDASKIALVHLVARLWKGGFTLLDTQFVNDHLKQFGVYEVPHEKYKTQLESALEINGDFNLEGFDPQNLVMAYLQMRKNQTA